MIKYWADTSALLHQKDFINSEELAISTITLQELEHIKTTSENDQIKFQARELVRTILSASKVRIVASNNHKIDKLLKRYPFLNNINDHRIICSAELCAAEQHAEIIFITNDALQYLFATQMPHLKAIYSLGEKQESDEWSGWNSYYPDEEQMTSLYAKPTINVLNCKPNEFAKIYEDNKVKDVLFWDGHEYRNLKYKNIKNPYLNEIVSPRNIEQKMAFDLLQNTSIKVKLLTSAWGSGKTLLALSYALEQVHQGNYQKLVFVRNNIIVADTKDIGFLPGDLRDKMSIWGAPLADHLGGQDMLDQLIDDGVIEIYPLSHMRGRSICNSIVLCDECENMNDKLITFLMSRIEKDSEIIFCGDVAQIDHYKFEKNNGIKAMLHSLAGDPLFGTVKLIKSERGPVAQLCDKIRPPV